MLTKSFDSRIVRKRAGKVRENWSPAERRRRMGLPPDVPAKLRDYFLGPNTATWASSQNEKIALQQIGAPDQFL
jgi:hypothetical protein